MSTSGNITVKAEVIEKLIENCKYYKNPLIPFTDDVIENYKVYVQQLKENITCLGLMLEGMLEDSIEY